MPTLVVNQGALGDVLMSLPALRLLRKARGEFTLAASPVQGLFLKQAGEVSSVIPSNASAFSELYTGSIPPLLKYFDDIWWFTRRRGLVPDIYLRPNNKLTSNVVFTVDEGPQGTNCSHFQFNQVKKQLEMEEEKIEDYLYPMSYSRGLEARNLFDLAVHPGSGSPKKTWPLENFLEIVKKLTEKRGLDRILFILGPAEEHLCDRIQEFVKGYGGRVLYMQGQELPMVADTLGNTKFFLGNDSGISHLAAWCGASSLLFFGPTQTKLWKPAVPNVRTLKSPAVCSPCGDAYRHCKDVHCMKDISTGQVLSSLLSFMKDSGQ